MWYHYLTSQPSPNLLENGHIPCKWIDSVWCNGLYIMQEENLIHDVWALFMQKISLSFFLFLPLNRELSQSSLYLFLVCFVLFVQGREIEESYSSCSMSEWLISYHQGTPSTYFIYYLFTGLLLFYLKSNAKDPKEFLKLFSNDRSKEVSKLFLKLFSNDMRFFFDKYVCTRRSLFLLGKNISWSYT